jgi:hypothetical protein
MNNVTLPKNSLSRHKRPEIPSQCRTSMWWLANNPPVSTPFWFWLDSYWMTNAVSWRICSMMGRLQNGLFMHVKLRQNLSRELWKGVIHCFVLGRSTSRCWRVDHSAGWPDMDAVTWEAGIYQDKSCSLKKGGMTPIYIHTDCFPYNCLMQLWITLRSNSTVIPDLNSEHDWLTVHRGFRSDRSVVVRCSRCKVANHLDRKNPKSTYRRSWLTESLKWCATLCKSLETSFPFWRQRSLFYWLSVLS